MPTKISNKQSRELDPKRRDRSAVPTRQLSITPRLLRIPEAAHYIGGTNWFVEELVRDNRIPFLIVGKYRVIDRQDLDEWIDAEKRSRSVAERAIDVAA